MLKLTLNTYVYLFAGDMSARSGTFSVGVAGVYQMSFTAKYVSSSKGRFGAWSDIYVNNTVSPEVYMECHQCGMGSCAYRVTRVTG